MAEAIFEVFRGDRDGGQPATYRVPIAPGMVVLDALHHIQAHQAPDLAVRWNCKAGKCGSCSAEVNGRPRLTCKTRMDALPLDKPITVYPMKAFPVIKDLVTDVSWNYRVNKKIPPFYPRPGTDWKMYQEDVDRVQEFRKCIECFLCQNVCHVLREHEKMEQFGGPRFFVRVAGLEMHPLDSKSRTRMLKDELGIGLCNITKCCTEVCPEEIHITDNAIIPLKERVVDEFYDPAAHAGAEDSRNKTRIGLTLTEVLMEFKLKNISKAGIPEAISKVELYRSLNEPEEAESICRDILAVEPEHQLALRLLGLAITDQFCGDASDRSGEVEQLFQRLAERYERLYYTGLLHERRAKAQMRVGRTPHTLIPLFAEAMRCFAEAELIRPTGNDDAILRWNRCARLLQSHPGFIEEKESEAFDALDSSPI